MSSIVSLNTVERVYPENRSSKAIKTSLSLVDSTAAEFSHTSAIWLFNSSHRDSKAIFDRLKYSLKTTLNSYPQLCGRLKAVKELDASYNEVPSHDKRLGRLFVIYGGDKDPGLELAEAESALTIDDIYPQNRSLQFPAWDCSNSKLSLFISQTQIVSLLTNPPEDPSVGIQIKWLRCGGFVLSVKMTHSLGDVHTLVRFVKDWASVNKAVTKNLSIPSLSPNFDPSIADGMAAGDINQTSPDLEIVQRAHRLPFHRYDWWISADGFPWPVYIPKQFKSRSLETAGKPMTWSEWKLSSAISHYLIHLTSDQVWRIWERAKCESINISKHDSVVAHIWTCINQSRGLEGDDNLVHCDLLYGLRNRLNLGENYLGSLTTMLNVEMKQHNVSNKDIAHVAKKIRSTIDSINVSDIQAHLHSIAYEDSPQRIWQAFLGSRHILVTSWVRAGCYEIDFGIDEQLVYVDGILPDMDGLVLIKEAPPSKPNSQWFDNGVDISLHICKGDVDKLLADDQLFP